MKANTLARTLVASTLAAGTFVAGAVVTSSEETPVTIVGPGAAELQPGQYVGPCSIVTPPDADPCEAAQLVLRYQFWGELVDASWFKKWKAGSPGDYSRLLSLMASPTCSTFANPQPQIMVTKFGAALANEVEAYACALGTEPISMSAPAPAPTGGDKTAPSAPGPVEIVPSGPTG